MPDITLPTFADSVDLRYFVEPLNAARHPTNYLHRFPETVYNKSPDSHLVRLMYTLLGPVGIGWLRANYTAARLQLEQAGVTLFDLDAFYGDPFAFGRILEENFADDITGLLTNAAWAIIKTQDESYRSRAITYMNAARLGTTPDGMRLAASSGLGADVRIVENYRFLFDSHSDDPLGLPRDGYTLDLGEWIILPQPAISRTPQFTIQFENAIIPLGVNYFTLTYNGYSTTALAPTALASDVKQALEAPLTPDTGAPLPLIGAGNVVVTGGPYPNDFVITLQNQPVNQQIPNFTAQFNDGTVGLVTIPTPMSVGAIDPNTETVIIPDRSRHDMQVAIDNLRPVATYPTFRAGRSNLHNQNWAGIVATSEYATTLQFVTGSPSVSWPATDTTHWIVTSQEIEAPRLQLASAQHYTSFHNPALVTAYTDTALTDPQYDTNSAILGNYNSVHVGPFPEMDSIFPFFRQFDTAFSQVFPAPQAMAAYPNPLTISAQGDDGTAFINGSYPTDYLNLQGVPSLPRQEGFWSSLERASGADILEIDLGSPQAVNYITMEVSRKPVSVEIDYDLLDMSPERAFIPVVPMPGVDNTNAVYYDPAPQNPWVYLQFYFNDGVGMIYTRYIRLIFTRRNDTTTYGRFLFDTVKQIQTPWSIDVRNVRIGRNVAPALV